ncbi:MAG: glycosyltransferase family 2 protein [Candidatus Saccharimonadaceae bacterium]|nr:glycosyltransferase family 2 protein [Candidatus Saccharimonadaceae bacterium]
MRRNLEIPQGKRTKLYRFLEILPGAVSYGAIILLFVLSLIDPVLGAIYLFALIATTLVKAIGVAYRTIQGYEVIKRAERVDWRKRIEDLSNPHTSYEKLRDKDDNSYHFDEHIENLKMMAAMGKEYPTPDKIYHVVIMTAYNEGIDVLDPSIKAVARSTSPKDHIIFVLAYEARGGEEMAATAKHLKKQYQGVFRDFILSEHPDNLPNEIVGKGPNLTYAGNVVAEYVSNKRLPIENIIVTSLDSDNHMAPKYLDSVAYEFITHPNRQRLSYQPVSLFMNNIWDAPAPSRIIAVSNSFFNVISTMRPHLLRNFASHSQPLQALEAMNFWSKRTIVEDGHQYWRSLFFFSGDYSVLPIRIPIYQDAVIDDTLWKTIKAQFIQVRRWYYGASDVAYVGSKLFVRKSQRIVPFWQLFPKFWRLLDGHVTLAILAPIVAFGGWVPMIMNLSSHTMVAYNLPNIVSIVETFASIGLIVSILVSFKMLPKRPAKYRKGRNILMLVQWILMPVTSILYQSLAAFYSQTRLMLGLYMEKFDVTKKVVKK